MKKIWSSSRRPLPSPSHPFPSHHPPSPTHFSCVALSLHVLPLPDHDTVQITTVLLPRCLAFTGRFCPVEMCCASNAQPDACSTLLNSASPERILIAVSPHVTPSTVDVRRDHARCFLSDQNKLRDNVPSTCLPTKLQLSTDHAAVHDFPRDTLYTLVIAPPPSS